MMYEKVRIGLQVVNRHNLIGALAGTGLGAGLGYLLAKLDQREGRRYQYPMGTLEAVSAGAASFGLIAGISSAVANRLTPKKHWWQH